MPVRKKAEEHKESRFIRLNAYQRGMIYMGFLCGMSLTEIRDEVEKSNGGHPSLQAVSNTIDLAREMGGALWDGQIQGAAGRPRETSSGLDKSMVRLVFKMRGRAVVTASYVRKHLREARKLSDRTIQRRLKQAGLAWLRRRQKSLISSEHKQARLD